MQNIRLEIMNDAQFGAFFDDLMPSYAAERALADHVSLDVARRHVVDQIAGLLPHGRLSEGHSFLCIVRSGSAAWLGSVWYMMENSVRQAFLYNITVFPEHRRQGIASVALAQVEERVRLAGYGILGLNVFAHNAGAAALYRKLGFTAVSHYMNKTL
jgi:ribosomal protein S18 acetylase RimI-like enzyme